MKRMFMIVLLVLFGMMSLNVDALESEPGGKNLANPAHFEYSEGALRTHVPLDVVSGQTYTLSHSTYPEGQLQVIQNGSIIVDETVAASSNCGYETFNSDEMLVCTFTSSADTVEIVLSGEGWHQWYHFFGTDSIQLELGATYTGYEAYDPVVDSPPEFSGSGLLILSYEEALGLSDIIGTHITAYDDIDGDLTDAIVVASDAYSGNETQVGAYDVRLEVTDSSNNTAYFDLVIQVKDEVPPVIEGPSLVAVDVNDALSVDTIITNNFTFYDAHDGPLTTYTLNVDQYSGQETVLGKKTVVFSVSDSSGNETSRTIEIDIQDLEPPQIHGPASLDLYLSDPYDRQAILAQYEASDNHTEPGELTIVIANDDAPEALDRTGSYTFTLKTADASGNETVRDIELVIIDNVPPTLHGISHVRQSYATPFDVQGYIETMNVSDNHDALSVDDIYQVDTNLIDGEIGIYQMRFGVKDAAGNETTVQINIEIIDDVAPVFGFSDRIIVHSGSTVDQMTLFNHLKSRKDVDAFNPTSMVVLEDSYRDNMETPGLYEMLIELRNDNGETMAISTLIEVSEYEEERDLLPVVIGLFIFIGLIGVVMLKRR